MKEKVFHEQKAKLYGYVRGMITELETDGSEHARKKAFLRHALHKPICSDMHAWAIVQSSLPGSLRWDGEGYGPAESAAYMALVLYASAGCHEDGVSFAKAAGIVGKSARHRLTDLERAETIDEVWDRLKCLVRVMTASKYTVIDFADMAVQLFLWQTPDMMIPVILDWDRQYYKADNKKRRSEDDE